MNLRQMIPVGLKQKIRNWQHRAQARAVLRAHKTAPKPIQRRPLDCALVIPVHNDNERLTRLIALAHDMNCFSQIVVVDDGSDTPVDGSGITLIRHETAKGAGAARNAGRDAVTSDYLLFFDSDDLLTAELPLLLGDLGSQKSPFDFCIFKHADSRTATEGQWGQPTWDEDLWQQSGLAIGALQEAPLATWPTLARTANYPWNKVYRTTFLRDNDIRCATTPVHQDITLHWLGFLAASRVLVSDRICAWHLIGAGAGHLTNRSGVERLRVFEALAPVVEAADAKGDAALQASLVRFVMDLMGWIYDHLDPSHHGALASAEVAWLSGPITAWRNGIGKAAPEVEAAIAARLAK